MDDLTAVYERQQRIGYPSQLFVGADEVTAHMKSLYPDWRAATSASACTSTAGGYGFNQESMDGLRPPRKAGARIEPASRSPASSSTAPARQRSCTPARAISQTEQIVVAVGPWVASLWSMLGLPDRLDVRQPDGEPRQRPGDVDLLVPAGGRSRV